MRCTNCGWDNPDENVRCEKCDSPLRSNVRYDEPTIIDEPTVISKTIREPIIEDPKPSNNHTIIDDPIIDREPQKPPVYINEPIVHQDTERPQFTGGTIPPWAQGIYSSMGYCKLTPLPNMPNEKHMPKEVNLKGNEITLKRDNVDPDNMTISQNNQASLTCKDGKWYIKDESMYKTTFVYAGRETPLQNGDVILLGNRRYVFSED